MSNKCDNNIINNQNPKKIPKSLLEIFESPSNISSNNNRSKNNIGNNNRSNNNIGNNNRSKNNIDNNNRSKNNIGNNNRSNNNIGNNNRSNNNIGNNNSINNNINSNNNNRSNNNRSNLNNNRSNNNDNSHNNKKEEIKINIQEKIKQFESKKPEIESTSKDIKEKPEPVPGSVLISNENPDMELYKYAKIEFFNDEDKCKILLFIGNHSEQFVDSFINIYAGVNYDYKFRYTKNNLVSNDIYEIYCIKRRIKLIIICFPKKMKLGEFTKNIFDIFFFKKLIPQKIDCVFITSEKKEELDKNQKIMILSLFNLLEKGINNNRIKFLFSSNDSFSLNDNDNKSNNEINDIIFNEYFNISQTEFDKKYNPEYVYINNKSIYDKNSQNSKRDWNNLYKNIKNIIDNIIPLKGLIFNIKQVSTFKEIVNIKDDNKISEYKKIFSKYNKNEQILIINYLLSLKMTFEISSLILYLLNKILSKIDEIEINNQELFLTNKNELYVFCKLKFPNLKLINFKNNNLYNNDLDMIKNLFSENLIKLNLSENKFTDIKIFDNEENLINLNELDLSNNKIKDIESLINCKFPNLITLNLRNNEIEDISCLEKSNSFNKLEILNLSKNKIKSLNIIEIKSLEYLNLMENEISVGLEHFLDNFYFNMDKLKINKDNFNNILFEYYNSKKSQNSAVQLKYYFEGNKINETLKNLSFKGIENLEIIGLNDFEFLNNESLTQLKILNIDKINDLTILKDNKFKNLERIIFSQIDPIKNGFNLLNIIFQSIVINNIKIEEINDNYNCLIKSKYPEFVGNFIFNDLNFLKEKFLENVENIDISQEILDNENNFNVFSLNEIKNSFPIFKKLKCENLDINYNQKYIYTAKFFSYDFKMNFIFDDLNYIFDDIFNEIKRIKLSNIKLKEKIGITKEKFPHLEILELNKNNIESMEIFSEINDIKDLLQIESNSNICNNELLKNFDGDKFEFNKINTNENKLEISYYSPIYFYLYLDELDKTLKFENCKIICLNNVCLTDKDINAMNIDKNNCLEDLNLEGNNITSLEFLNNVDSSNLKNISLKNNLINNGINIIKNKDSLKIKSLKTKLKEDEQNFHIISFEYFGKYNLTFDYLSNINESLDLLKGINFSEEIEYLDLSGIKLKNINFLENETMKNISSLNIDDNEIEDISIFEKISYKFKKLSIKKNPIRKGIHVFNLKFFNTVYIEIEINKMEYEYKIRANFIQLSIDIEFYINDINVLKNSFDFKNTFINILNGYSDELQILNYELINKINIEPKIISEQMKLLLDKLDAEISMINLIKENDRKDIFANNDILINENNKEFLEKLFIILRNKSANHYFVNQVIFSRLKPDDEKLIMYFPFLYIHNLVVIKCDLNLICLRYLWIENLDLSKANINDIKGLCQLTSLKSLNLSNNPKISNLFLLKDAKFKDLEDLNLSHDNIKDLYEIKMNEYKFKNLTHLNISHNEISNILPIIHNFKNLTFLDIKYNRILYNYELIGALKTKLPNCEINYTNEYILNSGTYIK